MGLGLRSNLCEHRMRQLARNTDHMTKPKGEERKRELPSRTAFPLYHLWCHRLYTKLLCGMLPVGTGSGVERAVTSLAGCLGGMPSPGVATLPAWFPLAVCPTVPIG